MSEEILKVELAELLQTVRFKRPDGTILEGTNIEAIRTCCSQLRPGMQEAVVDVLFQFINAADRIAGKEFPIRVEFAVRVK